MHTIARVFKAGTPVVTLATLTFATGVAGMGISFLYLASAHPLDVLAGAAGFIAGSVLAAAGLLSLSLARPVALTSDLTAPASTDAAVLDPSLDVGRWLAHFQANRLDRAEPDWNAPITLASDTIRRVVKSLEQFLRYIRSKKVWVTRRIDIARHWLKHHPYG